MMKDNTCSEKREILLPVSTSLISPFPNGHPRVRGEITQPICRSNIRGPKLYSATEKGIMTDPHGPSLWRVVNSLAFYINIVNREKWCPLLTYRCGEKILICGIVWVWMCCFVFFMGGWTCRVELSSRLFIFIHEASKGGFALPYYYANFQLVCNFQLLNTLVIFLA